MTDRVSKSKEKKEKKEMSVTTVKYRDPRIVLPDPPTFGVPITAKAINQYRLPASALSNTSISFNNLVTLGMNQMYSNTFQVEVVFELTMTTSGSFSTSIVCPDVVAGLRARPFPFASVTDQVRVNLNGTVLSSQVAYMLPARLQYMDQEQLLESYINECACVIPKNHQETGSNTSADPRSMSTVYPAVFPGRSLFTSRSLFTYTSDTDSTTDTFMYTESDGSAHPAYKKYHLCNQVTNDPQDVLPDPSTNGSQNTVTFTYTTCEPIFCSPFASRLDANYGSPIMGIQSLDISFTLNDLRRAFLMYLPGVNPSSFAVTIKECNLLYDVISVIESPTTAIVGPTYYPYRVIEPYVTDFPSNPLPNSDSVYSSSITSGVYTLTRVPTAIWVWIGPTKGAMQHFSTQASNGPGTSLISAENDYFAAIDHVNITMGNTTQILNNASVLDLYRTAKANGCQLEFLDFSPPNKILQKGFTTSLNTTSKAWTCGGYSTETPGPGTVLRLIPGLDLIMSDRELIPGSACENIVFQLTADFRWLLNSTTANVFNRNISLWLGFEYAGIIEVNGGTATLNTAPLTKEQVSSAPVISVTSENMPARAFVAEGGSIFDKIWNGIKNGVKWLRDKRLVSKVAKMIPHPIAQTVGSVADTLGFGYPTHRKRGRYEFDDNLEGGAIMGLGDFT